MSIVKKTFKREKSSQFSMVHFLDSDDDKNAWYSGASSDPLLILHGGVDTIMENIPTVRKVFQEELKMAIKSLK